jgi:hypothetical protein
MIACLDCMRPLRGEHLGRVPWALDFDELLMVVHH